MAYFAIILGSLLTPYQVINSHLFCDPDPEANVPEYCLDTLLGFSFDQDTIIQASSFPPVVTVPYSPNLGNATHVRPSAYQPKFGGINCDSDCSVMSDGLPWDESDYGNVGACPKELFYDWIFIDGIGWIHCRDWGEAMTIKYDARFGVTVIPVDVLWNLKKTKDGGFVPPSWSMTVTDQFLIREKRPDP